MSEYEIRILQGNNRPPITYVEIWYTDDEAIYAGRRAAGGRDFEVWREMDCIFRICANETRRAA